MRVRVNGEWREAPDGTTMADLLQELSLRPDRVAVERNKALLPRAQYAQTPLQDQDELEIVTLVGGG